MLDLTTHLIKSCTCGNTTDFTETTKNTLSVLICSTCGVVHQKIPGWATKDLVNFYEHEYHKKFQEQKGVITYKDRYEHDCRVADTRLQAYNGFLPRGTRGLDIGSSNSAFVHCARANGYQCLGLEPGENIGDDAVTIRGALGETFLNADHWDWITMHDSVEHIVDMNLALQQVWNLLVNKGRVVIDLPDYWKPAGQHHWKSIEHLWFHTAGQMQDILHKNGFTVEAIKTPIPGQLVFYAVKA